MLLRRRQGERRSLAILLIVLCATPACLSSHAIDNPPPISSIIFHISVLSSTGSAEYQAWFEDGVWDPDDQTFSWALPEETDLIDSFNGQWLATLTDATVFARAAESGEIELNLGVISGPAPVDVIVDSPLVSLSETIPSGYARGRASASITLTDGENDGAQIVGIPGDGTGIYRSYYNGFVLDGTRFTHLVGLISIEGGGTVTASQSDPVVGYRRIHQDVRDLSARIAFTITPLELAFATTTVGFPEPPACLGDLDGNGRVNLDDLAEMLIHYGYCKPNPHYCPECDLDHSGCIDVDDLGYLLSRFGIMCW